MRRSYFMKRCPVLLLTAVVMFFLNGCVWMNGNTENAELAQLGLKVSEKDPWLYSHSLRGTLKLVPRRRHCYINGMLFYLPHVVTVDEKGRCQVSALSIEKVIKPLFAEHSASLPLIRQVILDPGHGNENSGAVGVHYKEKDLNLALSKEIANSLEKRGIKVRFTRTDDTFLTLEERGIFARPENGDLFLSIHHNASANKNASGVETYIATPCGSASTNDPATSIHKTAVPGNLHDAVNIRLAAAIQKNMVRKAERRDRGVRFARFRVLVLSQLPGALIEAGFVSTPSEELLCGKSSEQRKIAEAIAEAVVEYNSNALSK